ncbi:hypothetical protein MKZ38_009728 [Zalerion maritima]|uniref:Uncharacterized protein n=1 Tax=Zalerion maritima TaxID=339359 RepID=A0AAD5WUI9_9PEZI|nr:hypothetical protein MKZ38_009728 [Zalerion maritima]
MSNNDEMLSFESQIWNQTSGPFHDNHNTAAIHTGLGRSPMKHGSDATNQRFSSMEHGTGSSASHCSLTLREADTCTSAIMTSAFCDMKAISIKALQVNS